MLLLLFIYFGVKDDADAADADTMAQRNEQEDGEERPGNGEVNKRAPSVFLVTTLIVSNRCIHSIVLILSHSV